MIHDISHCLIDLESTYTHYLHAVDTKLNKVIPCQSTSFLHLQQYCTKTNEITKYQAYEL